MGKKQPLNQGTRVLKRMRDITVTHKLNDIFVARSNNFVACSVIADLLVEDCYADIMLQCLQWLLTVGDEVVGCGTAHNQVDLYPAVDCNMPNWLAELHFGFHYIKQSK